MRETSRRSKRKKKMMENRKLDGKRFDLGDMIKLF